MSATLSTPNYGLPIFEPNDIPTWLVDVNGAMRKIDTVVGDVSQVANKAAADVIVTEGTVKEQGNAIRDLQLTATTISSRLTTAENNINGLSQNITNVMTAVTEINENVTDLKGETGDYYKGVISPAETQLTMSIPNAAASDIIEIYSSVYGWSPTNVEYQTDNNQIVIQFDAVTENMSLIVWRRKGV